jgi:hypothetical protein
MTTVERGIARSMRRDGLHARYKLSLHRGKSILRRTAEVLRFIQVERSRRGHLDRASGGHRGGEARSGGRGDWPRAAIGPAAGRGSRRAAIGGGRASGQKAIGPYRPGSDRDATASGMTIARVSSSGRYSTFLFILVGGIMDLPILHPWRCTNRRRHSGNGQMNAV